MVPIGRDYSGAYQPYGAQKIALTAIADQAHNFKVEATPVRTHGEAAVWGAADSCRITFTRRRSSAGL